MSVSPLLALPLELQEQVTQNLGFPENVFLRLTCRHFYRHHPAAYARKASFSGEHGVRYNERHLCVQRFRPKELGGLGHGVLFCTVNKACLFVLYGSKPIKGLFYTSIEGIISLNSII